MLYDEIYKDLPVHEYIALPGQFYGYIEQFFSQNLALMSSCKGRKIAIAFIIETRKLDTFYLSA